MVDVTEAVVDADILERAVYLACRASSLHNSQPWLTALQVVLTAGSVDRRS